MRQLKGDIISQLETADYVCVTADCWSAHHRSFLGVTCHYLTENYERQPFALACRRVKGAHTFDVIGMELQSILCDFKIQNKVHRIVTNNGSNFVKAFRMFGQLIEACTQEEEEEECEDEPTSVDFFNEEPLLPSIVLPPHQRCAAHTLNLVATKDTEKALDDSNLRTATRSMFAKASAVWNKQSRTVRAAENIKRTTGRQLVRPNATRWNSTFDSVKRLHQLEADSLDKMCDSLGLPCRFSARDRTFMAEFVQVMEPLARCLDFLQGEKCVGLGSLLPQLETLKARLEMQRDKAEICRPLAEAVLQGISNRFSQCYGDRECLLATVSDPRRKLTWTKDVALREKARSVFVTECDKFKLATPPVTEGQSDEDFLVFCNTEEAPEVSGYLSEPATSTLSVLDNYPRVKALFLRSNTTLPSSAAVERLFSCAGLILTKNRSRLTDENFEAKVFLKFNRELSGKNVFMTFFYWV